MSTDTNMLANNNETIFPVPSLPDIPDVGPTIEQVKEISTHILNSVTTWKEIDLQMHTMDVQLNAFLAKLDFDLDKYRASIPVVKQNLEFVQSQISKILDKALSMEANTESEINLQCRLMDMSNGFLDRLTDMMIKLV